MDGYRLFKVQFGKVQPFRKSRFACHLLKPFLLFGLSFLVSHRAEGAALVPISRVDVKQMIKKHDEKNPILEMICMKCAAVHAVYTNQTRQKWP